MCNNDFLDAFERKVQKDQVAREQSYVAEALRQICKALGVPHKHLKFEAEYGFDWFHKEYPRFPARLAACKMSVDVSEMFSSITKSALWGKYFEILENEGADRLALFVRATGHGLFVMHNCFSLPAMPGFTRLVRVAKTRDQGIIFEPVAAFALSVREAGWTP